MFKNLFSPGRGDRAEATAITAIKSEYPALLIEPTDADLANALESWSWLGLPDSPPTLVSGFGDMLFKTTRGVVMLDTLEGALTKVASDFGDLRTRLPDAEVQDRVLSSVWIQAAQRRGLNLSSGECYDWAVAPALGGSISAEAVTKLSFVVKVNLAGQLHHQIKSLPPGTKINRVTIS